MNAAAGSGAAEGLPGTVQVAPDVVFRDLAGEAVILNLATGLYYGLDVVGTRAWMLLSERGNVEEVLRVLLSEYDVDETRLRADVETLVRELLAKGLLKPAAG